MSIRETLAHLSGGGAASNASTGADAETAAAALAAAAAAENDDEDDEEEEAADTSEAAGAGDDTDDDKDKDASAQAFALGAATEQKRWATVLVSENAGANLPLAVDLLATTKLSAKKIDSMLGRHAAAPDQEEDTGESFGAEMEGNNPDIGAGGNGGDAGSGNGADQKQIDASWEDSMKQANARFE